MNVSNQFAELLVEDEAHHLASRGVLRVRGEEARTALQALLTNEIPPEARGATYAVAVDGGGRVYGDLFVLPDDDGLLVDCDRSQAAMWLELIEPSAAGRVRVVDESERWRVFGLLNNQALFDDGTPYIRYADPRRHELGSRVLRPSEARESLSWRHEGKWRSHAYRLGVPGVEVFDRAKVDVFEAELHALAALHPARLAALGLPTLEAGPSAARRRVLPFRVEPSGPGVPAMLGEPILGGQDEIGRVVSIQGLFGLALTELAPWRAALAQAAPLSCAGEQVLIAWPTWLGRESLGRGSPAARGA
ncbi:MAG: hypothetical protein IT546_01555 [Caulobacteraceae bacterium]|nr:hypothetical protein [Caulobacteraceae bacterium]